jgi:hypothetical protein
LSKSKKIVSLDQKGDGPELKVEPPSNGVVKCCVCTKTENVLRWSGCHATHYCSKECQIAHKEHHAVYCSHIVELEKIEKCKMYGKKTVHQRQDDLKLRRKIMKLVGEKPMLRCRLGEEETEMLWDTGSMISMVDRRWVRRLFPDEVIFPVSAFLDKELHVQAANETTIQFDGVVLLDFKLSDEDEGFVVPLLVSSGKISDPILGYNVIEYLVLEGTEEQRKALKTSLGHQKNGITNPKEGGRARHFGGGEVAEDNQCSCWPQNTSEMSCEGANRCF